MKMFLRDSFDKHLQQVRENFDQDKKIIPVCLANFNNEFKVILLSMNSNEEKEAFANQIEEWIFQNKLTEFILIFEAWAVFGDADVSKAFLQKHGTLEKHPGRKEIISVQYCSAKEEIGCTAEIIRGTIPTNPTLCEWERIENKTKFDQNHGQTRFQGLFLKGKAGQN